MVNGGVGERNRFVKWIYFAGPAVAYAILIYFLSSLSTFPREVPSFWGFDKIIHFIEYFIFGALLYRWFSNFDNFSVGSRVFVTAIISGIIYAFTDEWHQSFVPGRDSSFGDVLFDAMGVLGGVIFYLFFKVES